MTKQELEKQADKYRAKAEKAYQTYQETGIQRYYREHTINDDIATAFDIAANAKENTEMMYHYKYIISDHAERLRSALASNNIIVLESAVKEFVALARLNGLCRD